jgi:acetyl/propionyl-CoA carboxylase alpha subunit
VTELITGIDLVEQMIRDQWRRNGSGRDLIVERTIAEVQ